MDNELLTLCKEVYRRTEWNPEDRYVMTDNYFLKDPVVFVSETGMTKYTPKHYTEECPLYTSDYLLEKLPSPELLIEKDRRGRWLVFDTERGTDFQFFSDTPLKALLKLTIALDDAGELK